MKVIIKTSLGDITVRLYDETPLHRDNFVKLAREGYYDGTLFHRVIKDFMIQGGDPDSKGAPAGKQLGIGGPDYTIEAEIKPTLFHKRGALAAARQGDEVNPERRSSGSQFYIVWGQVYNQGQIKQFAKQMEMQQMQQAFNALAMQHREEIMQLRRDRNRAGLQELQDKLANEAQQQVKANGAGMTAEQQKIYTTIGGTPHLDGQYTVFGEVEEGLDIVDQIQQAATGNFGYCRGNAGGRRGGQPRGRQCRAHVRGVWLRPYQCLCHYLQYSGDDGSSRRRNPHADSQDYQK